MSVEEYDRQCDLIREKNSTYLKEFEDDLRAKDLSEKTIKRHLFNVDLYINDFLFRERPEEMPTGCHNLGRFLGGFYIEKCMWSTPENIKTTAASIKKFYKSMLERNHISQEDYKELCDDIKGEMEFWQEDCAAYNDPSLPNPWDFF